MKFNTQKLQYYSPIRFNHWVRTLLKIPFKNIEHIYRQYYWQFQQAIEYYRSKIASGSTSNRLLVYFYLMKHHRISSCLWTGRLLKTTDTKNIDLNAVGFMDFGCSTQNKRQFPPSFLYTLPMQTTISVR